MENERTMTRCGIFEWKRNRVLWNKEEDRYKKND